MFFFVLMECRTKLFLGSIFAIGFYTTYIFTRRKYNPKKKLTDLIGNTPLVLISSLSTATGCTILAKAEFQNAGGSTKDRVALSIINDAEERGLIQPNVGCCIYEGTVGSTGISLATIARAKGYECHIFMPNDVAIEKSQLLVALGATVEIVKPVSIVDENHFVNLARKRALDMNKSADETGSLKRGFFCDQFENLANFDAHYHTTGPEIYQQTNGKIDAFCMGAGTGGTIAGIAQYLKPLVPGMKVILADPTGSGLLNKIKYGVMYSAQEAEGSRKRHQIDTIVEGVGIKRITENFKKALGYIDDAIRVTDIEALEMSRYIMKNDGYFLGSSSSVNLVAAYRTARILGPGHTIVTILCDHGSRHLTKFWSDDFLASKGLKVEHKGLEFFH
jgi:cysteine synthase A